jgi:cytochrome c-type biogenesis protein CcmH/NrfG
MDKFTRAKQLFDQHDLNGSLQLLDECIATGRGDAGVFGLRARIWFKQQNWGKAMNDFLSVLELDPENQEALSGLEMSRNILGFFNPDLHNP